MRVVEHHHDHGRHGAGSRPAVAEAPGDSHALSNRGSINRTAFSATVHCLTGCAIGEVLGMVIGTALRLGNWPTVMLSVVLAFFFGYSLTMLPLLRAGLGLT